VPGRPFSYGVSAPRKGVYNRYFQATDRAIDRFLAKNPKGKHGLVDYRLEDLGIDAEQRRQALAFYRERFGVADN
jgi:hypothetical protein